MTDGTATSIPANADFLAAICHSHRFGLVSHMPNSGRRATASGLCDQVASAVGRAFSGILTTTINIVETMHSTFSAGICAQSPNSAARRKMQCVFRSEQLQSLWPDLRRLAFRTFSRLRKRAAKGDRHHSCPAMHLHIRLLPPLLTVADRRSNFGA